MLIRSAFWTGRPRDGQEELFANLVQQEIIPAMRRFPGVQAVRFLWPEQADDHAPGLYCQLLVEFADAEAKRVMMSSAERAALRPRVQAAEALFDGKLSHIDYSVS